MRRVLVILLAAVTLVAGLGAHAHAQPTLDEVVEAVDRDGWYAEPGSDVDPVSLDDALSGVDDVAVVVVADEVPNGAEAAANQVRDAAERDLTVLVITPGEVAASESSQFTDAEIGDALDATLDAFDAGGTTTDAVNAFTSSLGLIAPVATPPGTDAGESGDSGGGGAGGFLIFLVVVVAIIGGLIWWAKRRATKVDIAEVERAKAEIREQLELVADGIVEHEHTIDLSDNDEAVDHYRSASATYQRVTEEVEETENLLDLAEIDDDVDLARWELDAALALVEGRDVPPKPEPEKPSACFFDPTHKPGTDVATIKTSAGDKEVRVCTLCAAKLERGERPEPRMIDVGGRRVPAAKAPRSHGGLGMGGLSIFEVVLGGLGALTAASGGQRSSNARSRRGGGVDLDWGEVLPRRRRTGDVFGPDPQPRRPTTLPRTRRSSARSRTRTRRPSQTGSRTRSRSRSRRR